MTHVDAISNSTSLYKTLQKRIMTLENKKHNKILKTNHFKLGMILSLTAVISFLILDQNESFATVFFSDDFNTDDWDDTGTLNSVNTSTEVLDFDGTRGAKHATSYDLGSVLDDDEWSLRFKFVVDQSATSSGGTYLVSIGIADEDHSVGGSSATHDAIYWNFQIGTNLRHMYIADTEDSRIDIVDTEFSTKPTVGTYYLELNKTSATTSKATIYSDSSYSTVVESETGSFASTLDGLRYIFVKNYDTASTSGGGFNGYIDDLELIIPSSSLTCNGLTVTIEGNSSNNVIVGTSGNDVIAGQGGVDFILGNGGNDTICGGDGDDLIRGGSGADYIAGDAGNDLIMGDEGKDTLLGNDGNDRIIGGSGEDTINGNNDDDMIVGGSENDTINGDAGTDVCDDTEPSDTVSNCEIEN